MSARRKITVVGAGNVGATCLRRLDGAGQGAEAPALPALERE
jgi:malate/lactate dehydrogenase